MINKEKEIEYYSHGNMSCEINYEKEIPMNGTHTEYYKDGSIQSTSIYKDGERQGDHIFYDEGGFILFVEHYENGKCISIIR